MMKSSGNLNKYETYLILKFSDMIDLCIAIMEYDSDLALIEFIVDLFPEGIKEENIQEYFDSFSFQTYNQIREFAEKTQLLLEISKRNQKAKNPKKNTF